MSSYQDVFVAIIWSQFDFYESTSDQLHNIVLAVYICIPENYKMFSFLKTYSAKK